MNKSIETIWKNGFLDDDVLIAPKVNNLYEKKSIHVIDKFEKMFKINLIMIFVGSFIFLAGTSFIGLPVTGICIFFLLNWLVINGKKELVNLNTIDKSVPMYQYMKSFDQWMDGQIKSYARLYTFFYPLFFLSFVIGFYFSTNGQLVLSAIIDKFPDASLLFGIPVVLLTIVAVITAIISYFAAPIYRWELNLVYGAMIGKLKDIISDMDELRT